MFCLLCLVLLSGQKTHAQCENALSIEYAQGSEENNFFIIQFADKTDWNDTHANLIDEALKQENWFIISSTLQQSAVPQPEIESIEKSGSRGLKVILSGNQKLKKGERYIVNFSKKAIVNNLILADCIGNDIPIRVIPLPEPGKTSNASNKKIYVKEVKERENADIYIEGIVEGARKAKAAFTIDASIGKRFPLINKGEVRRYFWKPFFNIKASTSGDADPDSLNFGVIFQNPTKKLDVLEIQRLYFTEAAKFEADRDFKNVNFVGDFRMIIRSQKLDDIISQIIPNTNINPFIGMEIGKNLKSPVDEIQGNLIARPLIGASLHTTLYEFNKEETSYKKTLTFETLFERRFLLRKEIALNTDDDGNFISVPLTRAPRDYVKSSLTFDFAKNFGFTLNYEYGSLPPLFKLVDNKFSAGLVFKGIFGKK